MTYSYTFVVRQTGSGEWTIFSEKGHVMHVLYRVSDPLDAETRARAWASSWSSVNVKVDNGKNEQRD